MCGEKFAPSFLNRLQKKLSVSVQKEAVELNVARFLLFVDIIFWEIEKIIDSRARGRSRKY